MHFLFCRVLLVAVAISIAAFSRAHTLVLDGEKINYQIRDTAHNAALGKLSIDVEVGLVSGALPNQRQLSTNTRGGKNP